jgi:iron(II)-dependent oxidoreductase
MVSMSAASTISAARLAAILAEARSMTLALVSDLTDTQMVGPMLRIVNPPIWEIGHVAWFQEKWALRHLRGLVPSRSDADTLYDSAVVAHDARWELPLPSRPETLALMQQILDRVCDRLYAEPLSDAALYFHLLALFHEDMHDEAMASTRQTLGYPRPRLPAPPDAATNRETLGSHGGGPLPGDVVVPGGRFFLGAAADEAFVFDNEKWAHPVDVPPFRIARAAVTNAEFAAFVEAGGYRQERRWGEAGWRLRQTSLL